MTLIPTLIVLLFTLILAPPLHAADKSDSIVLVHSGRAGSLYDVSANEYARRANARLGGLYKVEVRAAPQLGDGAALMSALMQGEADLVLPSAAMISVSDRFAIFELPFLIRNRAQIQALRGALLDRYLQPEAERKGLFILGLWESGFRRSPTISAPSLARNIWPACGSRWRPMAGGKKCGGPSAPSPCRWGRARWRMR
jgi:TRAP-type C4-dicarboxylate transport system substrate-binding protein